jgi:hypothetical protein
LTPCILFDIIDISNKQGVTKMLGIFKKNKTTKVKVVVEYELEYTGHINESDIDYTDVFEMDNIKNIKKVSLKKRG